VAAADFLAWRDVDDFEGSIPPPINNCLHGVVLWNAIKLVMELFARLSKGFALTGRKHGFGALALDLVGDPSREVAEFHHGVSVVVVIVRFGNGCDRGLAEDVLVVEHGEGGRLAVELDDDPVAVGSVTDQTVVARSVEVRVALPTVHSGT
jgi:hypothetical protein